MPAKSKSQQRLMGMVHAYQKGELKDPSGKIKDVAKHINADDARDFAKTKHKGLPMHTPAEKKAAFEKLANLVTNFCLLKKAGILPANAGSAPQAAGKAPQVPAKATQAPAKPAPAASAPKPAVPTKSPALSGIRGIIANVRPRRAAGAPGIR